MDFEVSRRSADLLERLTGFMDECVYPAEATYHRELGEAGHPHAQPGVMQELKAEARRRGLWNLFHPDPEYGAGLSCIEYAPLAEIMGRSAIGSEACNCSAPDTGNMELLTQFGSAEQKERWLRPLLDGEIRSAFAMTEPDVASSDATNVRMRIERQGGEYLLNGRKWWITNAMHPHCRVFIVMGKTNPDAPTHRQQSMILVPRDTQGVTVLRNLTVFGYADQESHCEVVFENVRVPVENIIAEEGAGFAIAQARLGPGRIHHCMRALGAAERALELMCRRACERVTFGAPVASRANIMDWIAESRTEIEMGRLLTLKTAWLIDTAGNRQARTEIAAIKVAVPRIAAKVIDRAIQVHGSGGLCGDFPLAAMYALIRCLRLADGPDEVHNVTVARRELGKYAAAN
ncbi:acyl-CoA dehydrogenase family protein [Mycobacterium sp. E2479]|uniref:acyl-CoA dehydrogenase family protein n=1 Tax=Mycobacterium sp. E2479 TaxID=1834134 RepID=UPI0007FE2600|nr:acyl-CoA dehydrogenase family protein [Mycobacterium sp. E2479]OBH50421.1 acyl-CoA dehydrogenase [Mycobacterium sp. E2479]